MIHDPIEPKLLRLSEAYLDTSNEGWMIVAAWARADLVIWFWDGYALKLGWEARRDVG